MRFLTAITKSSMMTGVECIEFLKLPIGGLRYPDFTVNNPIRLEKENAKCNAIFISVVSAETVSSAFRLFHKTIVTIFV